MSGYGLSEYPPDYQTNPYCIEYARSGRATCQGCKGLIAKGDLRMGSPVQFQDQGLSYKWRHFRCLTGAVLNNMRGKIERHGRDAAITGLDKLKPQDYRVVERTLGAQGLAAAQEGASSEEEEVATSDSSSGDEETDKKQRKREKQGEGEAAHKPGPAIKTPKKRAPNKRAPRAAAKRRVQEDSDEEYQPGK